MGIEELKKIIKEVKESKVTDFPQAGDDETVTLSNSKYDLFPMDYAERIRNDYPEIWALGGNILGNQQYRILRVIRLGVSSENLTPRQEEAIRLREAWSARHYENYQIAGVIAQVKWHTVGSKGLQYMKDLINEEIQKRNDEE
jgi:hypothetical protein